MDESDQQNRAVRPQKWTDEMVAAYLADRGVPLDRWRANDGVYGYIDEGGQEMLAMDDDDNRVDRILRFLRKIGAPELR